MPETETNENAAPAEETVGAPPRETTPAIETSPFHISSPWAQLLEEVEQGHVRRKEIIRRLESHLGGTVVTYFCSFRTGIINDLDVEMLENVLLHENHRKLFLIINAPGGDGLAAERIVNVCRSYAAEGFECVVPHMAKSAATVVCLGSDQIHMSPTAELGPVDPQVTYKNDAGERIFTSADELVRAYDSLFSEATSGRVQVIDPYLQQLQRFDARHIEQLRSVQKLTEEIACRMAKKSMMADLDEAEIKEKLKLFIKQEGTRSHGRMLGIDDASACGLKVNRIDVQSELWKDLWTLYTRTNWLVSDSPRRSKIIESAQTSLSG